MPVSSRLHPRAFGNSRGEVGGTRCHKRLCGVIRMGQFIAAQTDLPRADSPRRKSQRVAQKVARNSSISTKVSSPDCSDGIGWLSQSASGS